MTAAHRITAHRILKFEAVLVVISNGSFALVCVETCVGKRMGRKERHFGPELRTLDVVSGMT